MILKTFSAAWVEGVFSCGLGVRRCAPPAGGVSDAGSVCGVPGGACDVPAGQRGAGLRHVGGVPRRRLRAPEKRLRRAAGLR